MLTITKFVSYIYGWTPLSRPAMESCDGLLTPYLFLNKSGIAHSAPSSSPTITDKASKVVVEILRLDRGSDKEGGARERREKTHKN